MLIQASPGDDPVAEARCGTRCEPSLHRACQPRFSGWMVMEAIMCAARMAATSRSGRHAWIDHRVSNGMVSVVMMASIHGVIGHAVFRAIAP